MADDNDEWPKPLSDPDEIERAREAFAATADVRRRVFRYAYVGVVVLVVLVVILALTR